MAEKEGKLAGKRRLALVVGVGQYQAVPQLIGPSSDARKVYELLTNPIEGYGFPEENVCLLLDDAATKEQFKKAFQQCLVDRAQNGDIVVLYFAGHGSISFDSNGDESDRQDETLMLVDSRTDEQHFDLVDDELNLLLSGLFQKMSGNGAIQPQNVIVILDSCNSGTAARMVDSSIRPRFHTGAALAFDRLAGIGQGGETDQPWDGASLPGLVFLSAAIDGTSALERDGEGLFTRALITTLKAAVGSPLTYEQLILRMRPLVAASESNQKLDVQGGTFVQREVFGDSSPRRPASYLVKSINGNSIRLTGLQMPGWSEGATVRIYAGTIGANSRTRSLKDFRDPSRAKATAVIDATDGLTCQAHLTSSVEGGPIEPGDVAILALPGRDAITLPLRLTSPEMPGGIPESRAASIRAAIARNPATRYSIRILEPHQKGDAWSLALNEYNRLRLFDASGRLRLTFSAMQPEREALIVAQNLQQHARQKALLMLKGEAGDDFVNDETLKVWLEPGSEFSDDMLSQCPQQNYGLWDSQANGPDGTRAFRVPLCSNFRVHVKVSETARVSKLYVGGLILSSDGSILGFPGGPDGNEDGFVALKPGEEWTFRRLYTGLPPIKTVDHVLVFGNREENKVEWSSLTEQAARRGTEGTNALSDALQAYFSGGTRAIGQGGLVKATTWTTTYASLRVLANQPGLAARQKAAGSSAATPQKREFTLSHYDIREFLPANPDSALYKLLMVTHHLANLYAGNADGPRYNQDTVGRWDRLSDADNLTKGIDCSRAIWFAFTRAGLVYNQRKATVNPKAPSFAALGAYLSTRDMVDKDSLSLEQLAGAPIKVPSPMRDQFMSCRNDSTLRTGDVLVYRRTKADPKGRADGHVVMVIDPQDFVAWGSHAWDSNNALSPDRNGADTSNSANAVKKDSGVEYQQIRRLKAGLDSRWEGWDSANMILVDCWRHKTLIQEWEASPLNHPGTYDLELPLKESAPWSVVPPTQTK